MLSSARLSVNRTSGEIVREIWKNIRKTSSVPKSDAISRQYDNKIIVNLKFHRSNKSWASQWTRHNNIRTLCTIQTKVNPPGANQLFVSKEEINQFNAIFPDLVTDLTDADRHTDISEATERFANVLQYVPTGKKHRGLSAVMAYKMLEKPENLTLENIRLANVVGWCVEMLLCYMMIIDDIMDNSETRRGVPCWFRDPNLGLHAINDAIFLECGAYQLLKKYFSSLPCYVPIVQSFQDASFKALIGQSLDTLCMKDNRPRLDAFNMNRYLSIAKNKTSYLYQLSIVSAMFLANIYDEELHRQTKTIFLDIGLLFQIQDDFLDCFGNNKVTGKKGSDIKDGKCTWLSVVAMQKANPAQKKVMEKHYGRPEEESIQIIRNLYEELSLPSTYAAYEEESYNLIRTQIHQTSKGLPQDLFFKLIDQMYKRNC